MTTGCSDKPSIKRSHCYVYSNVASFPFDVYSGTTVYIYLTIHTTNIEVDSTSCRSDKAFPTIANTTHEKPFIFQLSGAVSPLTGQSSTWLEKERERERLGARGGGVERQKTDREKARGGRDLS